MRLRYPGYLFFLCTHVMNISAAPLPDRAEDKEPAPLKGPPYRPIDQGEESDISALSEELAPLKEDRPGAPSLQVLEPLPLLDPDADQAYTPPPPPPKRPASLQVKPGSCPSSPTGFSLLSLGGILGFWALFGMLMGLYDGANLSKKQAPIFLLSEEEEEEEKPPLEP